MALNSTHQLRNPTRLAFSLHSRSLSSLHFHRKTAEVLSEISVGSRLARILAPTEPALFTPNTPYSAHCSPTPRSLQASKMSALPHFLQRCCTSSPGYTSPASAHHQLQFHRCQWHSKDCGYCFQMLED